MINATGLASIIIIAAGANLDQRTTPATQHPATGALAAVRARPGTRIEIRVSTPRPTARSRLAAASSAKQLLAHLCSAPRSWPAAMYDFCFTPIYAVRFGHPAVARAASSATARDGACRAARATSGAAAHPVKFGCSRRRSCSPAA
jgi:hypothetical protein